MIILTSYGFRNPIIAEKLKSIVQSEKTILIIPFAGFNHKNTAIRETDGLISFGFRPENIHVLDKANADTFYQKNYDYIYVPGGDPTKLLHGLQKLQCTEKIAKMVREGTSYIGVSAGAVIATYNIEYVTGMECTSLHLDNYRGLGLINSYVICHSEHFEDSVLAASLTNLPKRRILRIKNSEIHIIDSDTI